MNYEEGKTAQIRSESPTLLSMARGFRKEPTPTEARAWQLLRGRRLGGLKFRRQHVLDGHIVDFFCFESRLCIELDGAPHLEPDQMAKDLQRDVDLRAKGYRVLRMMNNEVNADIEGFKLAILDSCR